MNKILRLWPLVALGLGACGGDTSDVGGELAATPKLIAVPDATPDRYIVVLDSTLDPTSIATDANQLVQKHGGRVRFTYQTVLHGFAVEMTAEQAQALAQEPSVRYVEQDGRVYASAVQSGATWGIDRVDQANLPLDHNYTYHADGTGVTAYVIDTGIRPLHREFGGRASVGTDTIGGGQNGIDCHGHGTHVAGTIGSNTYGLAKQVKLVGIRVLDCSGSGSDSNVIAGIEWMTQNHVKPAVANMSLGGDASAALDAAVQASIAAGITYAIAAGNSNTDACSTSPSRVPEAITVGATTNGDKRASFSNLGRCVDIFAPGQGITSAWGKSDTAINTIDGTSMASPHVAGAAVLYLQVHPTASPEDVAMALLGKATPGKVPNAGAGSPNLLLSTGWIDTAASDLVAPEVVVTGPLEGSSASGQVQLSADASDTSNVMRVDFYAGRALVGSASTAPYTITWNSETAANGSTVLLTAKALDSAGNVGTSTPVAVVIDNPGVAVYDAELMVPRCSGSVARCDSGSLLVGRGPLGPEAHAPNTINAACVDGASGSLHVEESVDQITVSTLDRTPLAAGKTVRIDALVWARSSYTATAVDLYAAADARKPVWTLVATLVPPARGAQMLSATYVLPAGILQAVRVGARYRGTADPCAAGAFNDRDDLVFAVDAP